jgi:hypothetical protein
MSSAQLYYEDVSVGDSVRPLYFYMEQMQLVRWSDVTGNNDAGHWHIWHNRHKEASPTTTERSGYDPSVTGQFKTALMEKMLMDWAGPRAWVKKMSVQYRVWDHFFELKTFTGTVTDRREENGEYLVEMDVEMAREDGRRTTKGTATVALPSASKKRKEGGE